MQTNDTQVRYASASGKTPGQRLASVLKWCDARGIKQEYSFFRGCDNTIEQYEARIRLVLRTSAHAANENDEPWIASMEITKAAIDNRKAAA